MGATGEVPVMTPKQIRRMLADNRHLNFVQRLLGMNENSPAIQNPDGTYSTHRMSSGSDDYGPYVFPTIVQDEKGGLAQMEAREAARYAATTGNLIRFKTDREARYFAEHYKDAFPAGWFDRKKR